MEVPTIASDHVLQLKCAEKFRFFYNVEVPWKNRKLTIYVENKQSSLRWYQVGVARLANQACLQMLPTNFGIGQVVNREA